MLASLSSSSNGTVKNHHYNHDRFSAPPYKSHTPHAKFPPTSLTLKHKLAPTKGDKKPIGAKVMATEASPNLFQQRSARAQHTGIAVGDVDPAPERRPEQHAQHALAGVLCDAVVIVHNTEEHQRVHHHLLDPRGPCPDARADHVHPRSSNPKPSLSPSLLLYHLTLLHLKPKPFICNIGYPERRCKAQGQVMAYV